MVSGGGHGHEHKVIWRSIFSASLARLLVARNWSSFSCSGVLGFSSSKIRMHLFMAMDK